MSGSSTPGGSGRSGRFMRQRHSQGGYASSGEDLEDDASSSSFSSRIKRSGSGGSSSSGGQTTSHRAQTWTQVIEIVIWVFSAAFIIYFGDRHSNLFYLLFWDDRIRRGALYLGLMGILLNVGIIFYTALSSRGFPKSHERYELLPSAAPLVTVLGFLSFCLFSYALWPIWSILTIPLLFTLFMCFMVTSPYLPIGPLRPEVFMIRAD